MGGKGNKKKGEGEEFQGKREVNGPGSKAQENPKRGKKKETEN